MSVQIIIKDRTPEWAVIPYEQYQELMEKAEMLEDIQDYDRVMASLERGDLETVPAEVAYALLDGGNPIKIWREYRGLTQEQLAGKARISIPYLSQMETGIRKGSIDVLTTIAHILNLTIDDIIEPINSPKRKNILSNSSENLEIQGTTSKDFKTHVSLFIDEEKIKYDSDRTDLYKISGLGYEYIELLISISISSIEQLSLCKANELLEMITSKNTELKLVRRLPNRNKVSQWIKEARKFQEIINKKERK